MIIKKFFKDNENIVVYSFLSVRGKAGFELSTHVKKSPRKLFDLCFFKIQDMVEEEQLTLGQLKDALPEQVELPENLKKFGL